MPVPPRCHLPERARVVKWASPVVLRIFSTVEATSLVKMKLAWAEDRATVWEPTRAPSQGPRPKVGRLRSPAFSYLRFWHQCDKSHGYIGPRVMTFVRCPLKLPSVVVHGSIYGFDRSRSCRSRLHPNTSLRDHACHTTVVPFICGERARKFSCDRPTMPHRSNQVNARQIGKPPASRGGISSWCARWGSAASRRRTDATT